MATLPPLKLSSRMEFVPTNIHSAMIIAAGTAVIWYAWRCIYNIYFHPLAKIPGSKWAAISPYWVTKRWLSGFWPQLMHEAHEKYGTVVRVSPNNVSFIDPIAWKEIYGSVPGRKPFLKSDWYDAVPGDIPNLVTSRDPAAHAHMRKTLSHGFSAKALIEQEDLIHSLIDQFIKQINNDHMKNPDGIVDLVKWFDYATFDIIGELAFGEPFGSLRTGEMHFWIKMIFNSIKGGAYYRALRWWPNVKRVVDLLYVNKLFPGDHFEAYDRNIEYAHNQVQKRIARGSDRIDFLGRAIAEREASNGSMEELEAAANILVLAGSETTSTSMSGILLNVGLNPDVYTKLMTAIRESFSTFDEINAQTTENIPYLKAVIDEGLRSFPPAAFGLPRVSPGATVAGVYLPEGTITYVQPWAACYSELNFKNATKFDPERWIDPENTDRKDASQPFSIGSRGCLGRNLAMVEMRIILSKFLWTYDYELGPGTDVWKSDLRKYIVWARSPLYLKIKRREGVIIPPLDDEKHAE